jgi:hypothetical protein
MMQQNSITIDGFIENLDSLTIGKQELSDFLYFSIGGRTAKYDILSQTENRDGNLDLKVKFIGYE